jgi:hypothetical protein
VSPLVDLRTLAADVVNLPTWYGLLTAYVDFGRAACVLEGYCFDRRDVDGANAAARVEASALRFAPTGPGATVAACLEGLTGALAGALAPLGFAPVDLRRAGALERIAAGEAVRRFVALCDPVEELVARAAFDVECARRVGAFVEASACVCFAGRGRLVPGEPYDGGFFLASDDLSRCGLVWCVLNQ